MVKRLALAGLALLIVFTFACKKKEEAPPAGMPGEPGGGVVVPPVAPEVSVPEDVKAKWSAVVLTVQDKTSGKSQDAKINIGGEAAVPGTPLKIQVVEFLPDFRMEGERITSASNELKQPAAYVRVFENGQQLKNPQTGDGYWLFSLMPQIHPFQHEKYGITLKEAIKKG